MSKLAFTIVRLVIVFVILGLAISASACVCDSTPGVDEAFKTASAVFTGRFLRSEYRAGIKNSSFEMGEQLEGEGGKDYEVLVYLFQVKRRWKGPSTRELVLISDHVRAKDGSQSLSDCGLGFEEGKEYLVYAYGQGDGFGSGACTRTVSIKRAGKDISRLKRLSPDRRPTS